MKAALSHRRTSLNRFGTHSASFEKDVSKSEAADRCAKHDSSRREKAKATEAMAGRRSR